VLALKTLRLFWTEHPDAERPLRAWFSDASKADWKNPHDVKSFDVAASILADNRVVFNIKGNSYRLIVKINYDYRVVYIRFIGTHAAYDAINAEEV
jgi:mRNA interferase HigB